MRGDLRAVDTLYDGGRGGWLYWLRRALRNRHRHAIEQAPKILCKLYFVVTKQGARGRIQRGRYRSELARALEVVPHVPRRRPRALLLGVRLQILVELHQII